jgi:periplasmic copper chaperone A
MTPLKRKGAPNVKVRSYILGAALTAPLVLATAAGAHVTLQPEEVPAGGFTRLDVRVPTERPGASTTKLVVQFPPGFTTVSTEPVPGWTAKVSTVKLAKPQVNDEGEKITDRVDTVTWTSAGGQGIGPGQFQDFGLSLAVPDKAGSALTFKALQTYSNGEVVRWIGPPDSDEPAPQVKLTAAEEEGGGAAPAAAQEAASSDGDDGGGSDALSIIALIVGAAGLAAGIAALLRGRGRTRVGAA